MLTLVSGALIPAAGRWRGPRFPEFETRRLVAVRNDLDEEHTAAITSRGTDVQSQLFQRTPAAIREGRGWRRTSPG